MAQSRTSRKKASATKAPAPSTEGPILVDLDQMFQDYTGIFFPDQTGTRPITLRDAVFLACSTPLESDRARGPHQKYEIGAASCAVSKGLTVTKEQWKMIQERTGEAIGSPVLATLIRDAMQPLVDGTGMVKPKEEAKKEKAEAEPAP